jgi:hypothetical protein
LGVNYRTGRFRPSESRMLRGFSTLAAGGADPPHVGASPSCWAVYAGFFPALSLR